VIYAFNIAQLNERAPCRRKGKPNEETSPQGAYYPNDGTAEGASGALRLKQAHFLLELQKPIQGKCFGNLDCASFARQRISRSNWAGARFHTDTHTPHRRRRLMALLPDEKPPELKSLVESPTRFRLAYTSHFAAGGPGEMGP